MVDMSVDLLQWVTNALIKKHLVAVLKMTSNVRAAISRRITQANY